MTNRVSSSQLGLAATVWLIATILAVTSVIAGSLVYADMRQQREVIAELRTISALRITLFDLGATLQQLGDSLPEDPDPDATVGALRLRIDEVEDAWERSGQPREEIDKLAALARAMVDNALAGVDSKAPEISFHNEALRISGILSVLSDTHQTAGRSAFSGGRTIAGVLIIFMALALALAIVALRRALGTQKEMLKLAEDQSQRLTAMFDGSGDAMLSLDGDGGILDMNRSAKVMLGGDLAVYQGHSLKEIVALDEFASPSFRETVSRLAATDEPVYETQACRNDGTEFRVGVTLGIYHIHETLHYIATVRDITRRKLLEEAKNEFVSTVSHELRTPLTSISGSLDLLRMRIGKEGNPEPTRRLVEIAQSNAQRLIKLINDILDIERLEAGRASLALADVSLRELANEAIEINAPLGVARAVSLHLVDGQDVIVRADKDRLLQIATNFISNAVKFSPDGGKVTLCVMRAGAFGELSIRDEGPGVPAEFQPFLFEKFSQAADARVKGQGSSGLGLAISREIAEQLDGRVAYETAEGGGAKFTLALPATRISHAAPAVTADIPQILHFDPDPDMLRVVANAFGGSARVISVGSLAELTDAAREFAPDLIIYEPASRTKLVHSELDRIAEQSGAIPLIVFTSLDREALDDRSCDRHLVKSQTTITQLIASARQLLDRKVSEA